MGFGILAYAAPTTNTFTYQKLVQGVAVARPVSSIATTIAVPQNGCLLDYIPTLWDVQVSGAFLPKVYSYEKYFAANASSSFVNEAMAELEPLIAGGQWLTAGDQSQLIDGAKRAYVKGLQFYLNETWPDFVKMEMLQYQLGLYDYFLKYQMPARFFNPVFYQQTMDVLENNVSSLAKQYYASHFSPSLRKKDDGQGGGGDGYNNDGFKHYIAMMYAAFSDASKDPNRDYGDILSQCKRKEVMNDLVRKNLIPKNDKNYLESFLIQGTFILYLLNSGLKLCDDGKKIKLDPNNNNGLISLCAELINLGNTPDDVGKILRKMYALFLEPTAFISLEREIINMSSSTLPDIMRFFNQATLFEFFSRNVCR